MMRSSMRRDSMPTAWFEEDADGVDAGTELRADGAGGEVGVADELAQFPDVVLAGVWAG